MLGKSDSGTHAQGPRGAPPPPRVPSDTGNLELIFSSKLAQLREGLAGPGPPLFGRPQRAGNPSLGAIRPVRSVTITGPRKTNPGEHQGRRQLSQGPQPSSSAFLGAGARSWQ